MMSLIGIPIGFYGYLFPGNINLMVVELYSSKKYNFLIGTLFLILVFETFYCLMSLLLLNTFKEDTSLYQKIELVSYGMVFLMGIWMLFETKKDNEKSRKNTVYRGLVSVVLHPQQIPFWVIMGVVVNKFLPLSSNNITLYQFAFFNAIGTLIVLFFYMIFGSKLFNYLNLNSLKINRIMGLVYVVLAIYGVLYILI